MLSDANIPSQRRHYHFKNWQLSAMLAPAQGSSRPKSSLLSRLLGQTPNTQPTHASSSTNAKLQLKTCLEPQVHFLTPRPRAGSPNMDLEAPFQALSPILRHLYYNIPMVYRCLVVVSPLTTPSRQIITPIQSHRHHLAVVKPRQHLSNPIL